PRPTQLIKALVEDERTVISYGSTLDNADNLAPQFIEEITQRYQRTRLAQQELAGKLLLDVQGALWTHDMLNTARIGEAPALQRIVVAVDPATSTGENSDFTGITVAGLGFDDQVYVLHSEQLKVSPNAWASRAL